MSRLSTITEGRRLAREITGRRRGADYVADVLQAHNAEVAFGMPAESINAFVDACRRAEDFRFLTARHEGAASIMALAYAQVSRKLGVCAATNGPGAVHLLVGAMEAAASRTPLFVLSGQIPEADIGSRAFQEIDAVRRFDAVCTSSAAVWNTVSLPRLLTLAKTATLSRSPVHASISSTALVGTYGHSRPTVSELPSRPAQSVSGQTRSRRDDSAVGETVFLLGDLHGFSSLRLQQIASLAAELSIPVVVAPEYFLGPRPALPELRSIVPCGGQADLGPQGGSMRVIAFGALSLHSESTLEQASVAITVEAETTGWSDLANELRSSQRSLTSECLQSGSPDPRLLDLMRSMTLEMPDDVIIAVEAGPLFEAAARAVVDRTQRLLSPFGTALSGFAIPAALGASAAAPHATVIAVTDRQGLLESWAELLTARATGAELKILYIADDDEDRDDLAENLFKSFGIPAAVFDKHTPPRVVCDFLARAGQCFARLHVPGLKKNARASADVTDPLIDPLIDEVEAQLRDSRIITTSERSPGGVEAAALRMSAYGKEAGSAAVHIVRSTVACARSLNGLYDAAFDAAPGVIVTAGTFPLVDVRTLLREAAPRVRDARGLSNPSHVTHEILAAVAEAGSSQSLVHVQIGPIARDGVAVSVRNAERLVAPGTPSGEAVETAAHWIRTAKRPVMIAGRGAKSAMESVTRFANDFGIPILSTMGASGAFDDADLHSGNVGSSGHSGAARLLLGADVVIVVGVSTRGRAFSRPRAGQRIIAVNHDALDLPSATDRQVSLWGSTGASLKVLRSRLRSAEVPRARHSAALRARDNHRSWRARDTRLPRPPRPGVRLNPSRVIKTLEKALEGSDATVTGDVGLNTLWLFRHFRQQSRVMWTSSFATMGFAVPAAIARSGANEQSKSVAVIGDGGFTMTFSAFADAVRLETPVLVLILDNGGLGAIRYEEEIMGWPNHSSQLWNGDFAAFAKALGADGEHVSTQSQLESALRRGLVSMSPYIVHVVCSADEPPVPAQVPRLLGKVALLLAWSREGSAGLRSARTTISGLWNR